MRSSSPANSLCVRADRLSCKELKKLLYGHGFAIQFFDGIEPAKEWLLDERGI